MLSPGFIKVSIPQRYLTLPPSFLLPGLSVSSHGGSNRLFGRPSALNPSRPGAHPTVSSSPSPSEAGSLCGATPASWPATPGRPGPASSFATNSGGLAWRTTSGSSWQLVRCVPGARRPTDPRRNCSGPSPTPVGYSPTLPWTSLQAFPRPRAIPPS